MPEGRWKVVVRVRVWHALLQWTARHQDRAYNALVDIEGRGR